MNQTAAGSHRKTAAGQTILLRLPGCLRVFGFVTHVTIVFFLPVRRQRSAPPTVRTASVEFFMSYIPSLLFTGLLICLRCLHRSDGCRITFAPISPQQLMISLARSSEILCTTVCGRILAFSSDCGRVYSECASKYGITNSGYLPASVRTTSIVSLPASDNCSIIDSLIRRIQPTAFEPHPASAEQTPAEKVLWPNSPG